jgi:NADPH-dependent glutamate synthase beta subunit-like oxidoreductase
MLEQIEGSKAMARAIVLCRPQVACAYPITPQTHIVEGVGELREKMPAHDFELEEALQEGVTMKWLSTIKSVDGGSMTIEKMKLDATGFPQPTGELETLEADSLVLALGQDVDLSLLGRAPGIVIEKGVVKVGPDMMTGRAGVFAGGDMAPSERTVTVAVGHGKKAARCVDAYLRGGTSFAPEKHMLASFDRLNPWYYEDAPATVRPALEAVRRVRNFEELSGDCRGT